MFALEKSLRTADADVGAGDAADVNDDGTRTKTDKLTNQPTQISVARSIHSLKNWLVGYCDMTFEVSKLLICPIEM